MALLLLSPPPIPANMLVIAAYPLPPCKVPKAFMKAATYSGVKPAILGIVGYAGGAIGLLLLVLPLSG